MFTESCSHQYYLIPEHHSRKKLGTHQQSLPFPVSPRQWHPCLCSLSLWMWWFWAFPRDRISSHMTVCTCLLSPRGVSPWRVSISTLLYALRSLNRLLCDTPYSPYPFFTWMIVLETFWLFPLFSSYKWCWYEHSCAGALLLEVNVLSVRGLMFCVFIFVSFHFGLFGTNISLWMWNE